MQASCSQTLDAVAPEARDNNYDDATMHCHQGRESWLKQGQRWQHRQQWLWRQQTTTEIVGTGNNQQNAAVAAAAAETLVGKTGRNSSEFRDYSDSGPFQLQNFHRNFVFPIVKYVPANFEHILTSSKSSPAIDSSDFMHWKPFPPSVFWPGKITSTRIE